MINKKRTVKNIKNKKKGGASINLDSNIPKNLQWNNPFEMAPNPPLNGGLYIGAPGNGPWAAIPKTPTTSYMINENLKSANPPPRATTQYPLTNGPGNNFQGNKDLLWYISNGVNKGPFKLQVQSGGKKKSKRNKKNKSKIQKNKNKNKNKKGGEYSINLKSIIPLDQQWNSPNESAPAPPLNGGLYTGAKFNGPWGNIPVTPTAQSMMNNIKSTTPGAMKQIPTTIRPGNNFSGMPIDWYNPKNGPFKVQVVSKGGSRKKNKKKSK